MAGVALQQPRRRLRGQQVWRIVWMMVLVVLVSGCLLAQGAKFLLKQRYQPLGQMVDIGGYALHLHCTGTGSPTIILEAGQGESSLSWSHVQPALSVNQRVCSYDRAGLGWSDVSPDPRTATVSVDELHRLLEQAQIEPPYVFVGHSLGGVYALVYAQTYPAEVQGLVLVDSAHPEMNIRQPEAYRSATELLITQTESQLDVIKPLSTLGLIALYPSIMGASDKLPADAQSATNALFATRPYILDTNLAEFKASDQSFAEINQTGLSSLDDLPMIILVRDYPDPLPPSLKIDQASIDAAEATHLELQQALTLLSSRSQLQIVPHSGHYILLDQPQAVIDAVHVVLQP